MKTIFSFITLFIFFVIGFFLNSIMVFAVEDKISFNVWENIICCIDISTEINNNCIGSNCIGLCCIESRIEIWISFSNNSLQKKILKITNNFSVIDIFTFYSLDNKSLVNKTSPPYYERDISNYSYHTLVKIIKSNT